MKTTLELFYPIEGSFPIVLWSNVQLLNDKNQIEVSLIINPL